MATLTPYFYSRNAREQSDFYVKAFGGEIVSLRTFADMPGADESMKDRVLHLELQALGLRFFMADAGTESVDRGKGLDLTLEFKGEEEARRIFEALSRGGKVIMPFERMFWGAMFGRLEDPFGVIWQISTEV
ncbi:VOC family protein [Paenibacillus chondroitinus]|uniref:VOC family protein n=1 Tax=Paenibacillus chondroitinus TaxID=59842 RepID=A0ABU6D6B2_9BACL|nr:MULTISPECIES: VOC family protein [Paenibacillus]MCY9657849.1 VOC family protein [Paenibacillus anseongense]MEB4793255.1 VOC family protein [Paenibacillus chondroitinus]